MAAAEAIVADPDRLATQVANRPSIASSLEQTRYRARFDKDRFGQLLDEPSARSLADHLLDGATVQNFEDARVELGRMAVRHLGLVDHSLSSVDWFFYRDITRIVKKMKPWIEFAGGRVHVLKIVRLWICPPQQLVDPVENQHAAITPHEARLSNTAYECLVVGDVAHWTYVHPRGTMDHKIGIPAPPANSHAARQLPENWQSWPLESCELQLRKPLTKLGVMSMSWIDRRATGTLPPHAFAFEDKHEEGAAYACQNSSVAMPLHETLAHNQAFVFSGPAGSPATVNDGCETPDESEPHAVRAAKAVAGGRLHSARAHRVEIRCCHPCRRMRSTSTIILKLSKAKRNDKHHLGGQQITVSMQFLQGPMSPTVIFLALGYDHDAVLELIKLVAGNHWYEDAFMPLLRKMRERHPPELTTREEAGIYIADRAEKENWSEEKKLSYANTFLQNELFPQIGLSLAYNADKALMLAALIHKLLMRYVGYEFVQSKDSYVHQRYDSPGCLWSSLMRQLSYKIHTATDRVLRTSLTQQQPINWQTIFGEPKNSEAVASAVSKGVWSVNRFHQGSARTGATLALKTTNFWTYASSVQRANTANKAHRRSTSARQIDETQFGRLCAVETPEGEMCGIARFKAVGSSLSLPSSTKAVLGLLIDMIPTETWSWSATPPLPNEPPMRYVLDLDGRMVWRCSDPIRILETVRSLRRSGVISPHVGCQLDNTTAYIRTSPGRNLRLLINLKAWQTWSKRHNGLPNRAKKMTLPEALSRGILTWIDPMEERSLSIAFSFDDFQRRTIMQERFSHMEVDPSWMLGVTSGSLPFSDYNQAPRSVLGSAMQKQTFCSVVNPYRIQTNQFILDYPMRAIAQTRIMTDFQLEDYSTGQPIEFVVVATDHSMEDSWDYNAAAIERGLHKTSLLRRYVVANKPGSGNSKIERFEKPNRDVIGLQEANYDKIQPDGLPLVGTAVEPDDIIIGKTYTDTKSTDGKSEKHDDSTSVRDERGIVQSVRTLIGENGNYIIKEVVLRTQCLSEIGDKFFFRHGQKGTTGINRPEADCYFSIVSGRTPACAMNPIGILARMTAGLVRETLMTKAATIAGQFIDATPFLSPTQKAKQIDVVAAFLSVGAQRLGYETFINGTTGELTQPLLTGVCQMSALAHLVGSKIHARNRGPHKLLTRQPDDGRSKHGGLRFGQMEVDCFAALGCAFFLEERLKKTSDGYDLSVCAKCGLIAESSREGYKFCRTCYTDRHVCLVNISYANKLFLQELTALHIRPSLILAPSTADVNEIDDDDDDVPNAPGGPTKPPRADVYAMVPATADDDDDGDVPMDGSTKPKPAKKMSYYALSQLPQLEAFEWNLLGIKPPMNLRTKIEEMQADAQTEATAANKTERTPPTAPILWTAPSSSSSVMTPGSSVMTPGLMASTPNRRPATPNMLPPPRFSSSVAGLSSPLLPPTKRK